MASNQSHDRIFTPGEYNLDSLLLISYNGFTIDLRDNLLELVIHESLDGPCISGELKIGENVNLLKHVPLIANERLQIQLSTPSKTHPIIQTFFVYKISNKLELDENNKMSIYSLSFVSEEFMKSKKTKISRSYSEMTYGEMVDSIFFTDISTRTKDLIVQDTFGKKNVVIPYMNPIAAIQWLCTKSISDDLQDYAYMFYETFDNFCFTTINYQFTQNPLPVAQYLYYKPSESLGGDIIKDLTSDFRRIEQYQILTMNNTLRHVEDGLFGAKLLTHDITTKSFKEYDFSYNTDFYELDTINNYGLLPQNGDTFSDRTYSNYKFYPKQSFAYDNIPDNDEYQNVVLKRNAHLSHYKTFKLSMLVAGDTDRRIGDIVDVKIVSPEAQRDKQANPYDPYYSGKYLISHITHIIQKAVHKMRLTLERDSLPQPYPETKVVV